jgi:hypothetical protein
MKIRVRLALFGLAAAVIAPLFALHTASAADPLSSEQMSRIQANCLSIKGSLTQLHASDALLRVNRGQIYESIGTKLMDGFNSRLANNGLDNKGLVSIGGEYQKALASFRTDYQAYERQLSVVLRIDCTKDASGFHTALLDARTKRTQVHSDVVKLNQYIDDYKTGIDDFVLNFDRVSGKKS